jgi:hypothetical protein
MQKVPDVSTGIPAWKMYIPQKLLGQTRNFLVIADGIEEYVHPRARERKKRRGIQRYDALTGTHTSKHFSGEFLGTVP